MGLLDSIFGLILSAFLIGVLIIGGILGCLGICAVCPDSVENWVMTSGTSLPSLVFVPIEVRDYVYAHYSFGNTTVVHPDSGFVMVGADGHRITLINYKDAKDVTKQEVIDFIKADKTDQSLYTNTYQCGDFAETVHNNAESAGIRSAWVYLSGINHACNAFNTTDYGLIFIDCTHGYTDGYYQYSYGSDFDTIVDIEEGKEYKPKAISGHDTHDSMGIVTGYKIYW